VRQPSLGISLPRCLIVSELFLLHAARRTFAPFALNVYSYRSSGTIQNGLEPRATR
jgi:hypothetical protein